MMTTLPTTVTDEGFDNYSNSNSSTSSNYYYHYYENHETTMTTTTMMAMTIFVSGIGILITIFIQASILEGYPFHQLGKRPMLGQRGGLLQSIYYGMFRSNRNRSNSNSIGVLGYDPIQGALSPPLRFLCHCSMILLIWGSSTYLYLTTMNPITTTTNTITNDDTMMNQYYWLGMAGIIVVLVYTIYFYILFHCRPGVSIPSGPRSHKIQRIPQWDHLYWNNNHNNNNNNNTNTEDTTHSNNVQQQQQQQQQTHRYVHGQESYRITEQIHSHLHNSTTTNDISQMTGEPAGRDMWTTKSTTINTTTTTFDQKNHHTNTTTTTTTHTMNEIMIQTMASGGRSYHGFNPSINPNSADRIHREQMIRTYLSQPGHVPPSFCHDATNTTETTACASTKTTHTMMHEATRLAVHFYSMLQTSDGHWSGDYGGPHFLLPGLIVVWYCMGQPTTTMINTSDQQSMIFYMRAHQQTDGGWGTHIESPSTMFGTTLMYVALRLLGVPANDVVCKKGRAFIQQQGGAVMTSSWAKFYLCILGTMHWDGHNSVPPEMWLLPNWFPFHPSRMWCHARMVYLPMGYLYGCRYVYDKAETDPIITALREELYCEPYDSIQWDTTRHMVAPMDNYSPIPNIMRIAHNCLACYETWSIFQPFKNAVRKRGLTFCVDYMAAEDMQTNFIDIGPVNKVLNMLSAYYHARQDITHPTVINHMMRVPDYLWVAEDGMKMKGYNGSQCWDTSFAIQAIYEAGLLDEFPVVSQKAWSYLERCQILSTEVSQATPAYTYESAECRRTYYRHISEGGWPFSTSAHGWPISDCTGEGLKGVLCLLKSKTIAAGIKQGTLKPIDIERLQKAANVLLSYQNEDGGFATYENCRGFGWYESLNPSEVFGDIMIDYSYVECSMAALTGLVEFHEDYPNYRTEEIIHSIANGRSFLRSLQRDDGSWYGSWACCFCYACWFGIEGLIKCGESPKSECIVKACNYLLRHQRPNGGWGEDFTSCYDKEYASEGMKAYGDDGSGVVNTSWALLALSAAHYPDTVAIKRGVKYLLKRQLPYGDWPQEGIAGVFNRACGITYTAYRNVFPIWALGRCMATYGDSLND